MDLWQSHCLVFYSVSGRSFDIKSNHVYGSGRGDEVDELDISS